MGFKWRKDEPKLAAAAPCFCIWGDRGRGKSYFTATFPKIALLDPEGKGADYINHPVLGDNFVGHSVERNYKDVIEEVEEAQSAFEEGYIKTFAVDSVTPIMDTMDSAFIKVAEKKARRDNKDVDAATITMQSRGKMKITSNDVFAHMLDLKAMGCPVILVAQEKNKWETDSKGNAQVVGVQPDASAKFLYYASVELQFLEPTEDVNGVKTYRALVVRDNTGTYPAGTILENPTYETTYKNYIEGIDMSAAKKTSFGKASESLADDVENEEDANRPAPDVFRELVTKYPKLQPIAVEALTKNGINLNQPITDDKEELLRNIIKELKAELKK